MKTKRIKLVLGCVAASLLAGVCLKGLADVPNSFFLKNTIGYFWDYAGTSCPVAVTFPSRVPPLSSSTAVTFTPPAQPDPMCTVKYKNLNQPQIICTISLSVQSSGLKLLGANGGCSKYDDSNVLLSSS